MNPTSGHTRYTGNKPARFTLLPDGEPRWSAFGASAGMQFVALLLLLWLPLLIPEKLVPKLHYSVIPLISVKPVTPWKPQPPPKFKIRPQPPEPEPIVERRMEPPLVAPKVRPRVMAKQETPAVAPRFESVKYNAPMPPKPRPAVRTGVLGGGSSAPATTNRPAREVQTGGFGDPNGVPATGNGKRAATIAKLGSFDLPPGPGYGNGTGGARGVRGTVASAGFGNGVAVQRAGSGRGGSIKAGVFTDQARPVAEGSKSPAAQETPSVQPVEILAKPDPVYTAEARALRIEGEVLVQAVFTAHGEVRVLRVIRGLGHGLDEAAVTAARQIRFRPERMNGEPVDSTAIVHIVFQLAY